MRRNCGESRVRWRRPRALRESGQNTSVSKRVLQTDVLEGKIFPLDRCAAGAAFQCFLFCLSFNERDGSGHFVIIMRRKVTMNRRKVTMRLDGWQTNMPRSHYPPLRICSSSMPAHAHPAVLQEHTYVRTVATHIYQSTAGVSVDQSSK